jgi:hypothetical protein
MYSIISLLQNRNYIAYILCNYRKILGKVVILQRDTGEEDLPNFLSFFFTISIVVLL